MVRSAAAIAGENATTAAPAAADIVGAAGAAGRYEPLGTGDHVLDHAGDQPPHQFVDLPRGFDPGVTLCDLRQDVAQERDFPQVVDGEHAGPQPIIDVVGVIGDVVGDRPGLRLRTGELGEGKVLAGAIFDDLLRNPPLRVAAGRRARGVGQGAVVLDQAFEGFPGEVEAVEAGVAALQAGHHRQRLGIMVETAMGGEAPIERALAGMAEGRMAEVVGQRTGLREILVEAQRARQRAGDLGDFEGVGEPGAVMVAFVVDEHLRLVGEPAERGGMDDAVAIATEIAAGGARRLRMEAPPARRRVRGIGRAGASGRSPPWCHPVACR